MKFSALNVVHALLALLGVIIILTPFWLFPVCKELMKNGRHMSCYYSGWLIVGVGIVITVLNVVAIFLNKRGLSLIAFLVSMIAAIMAYVIPHRMIAVGHMKMDGWQIGYCDPTKPMGCAQNTVPAMNVMIPIVIVLAVVGMILLFLVKESYEE